MVLLYRKVALAKTLVCTHLLYQPLHHSLHADQLTQQGVIVVADRGKVIHYADLQRNGWMQFTTGEVWPEHSSQTYIHIHKSLDHQ